MGGGNLVLRSRGRTLLLTLNILVRVALLAACGCFWPNTPPTAVPQDHVLNLSLWLFCLLSPLRRQLLEHRAGI